MLSLGLWQADISYETETKRGGTVNRPFSKPRHVRYLTKALITGLSRHRTRHDANSRHRGSNVIFFFGDAVYSQATIHEINR